MNPITAFLFSHSYYNKVTRTYNTIVNDYATAFSIWVDENRFARNTDFETKELIIKHYQEIKDVHKNLKKIQKLIDTQSLAITWIYESNNKNLPKTYKWKDYCFLNEHFNKIVNYQKGINRFQKIFKEYPSLVEFIEYYSNFKEQEDEIFKIAAITNTKFAEKENQFKKMILVKEQYPLAWKAFKDGRKENFDLLNELNPISNKIFKDKEYVLQIRERNPKLFNIIIGERNYSFKHFTREACLKECQTALYLSQNQPIQIPTFTWIGNILKILPLKRAILGLSTDDYDIILEDFSVHDCYLLRDELDRRKLNIYDKIREWERYKPIILNINKEEKGRDTVEWYDYFDMYDKNSTLYLFIQKEKHEQELRKQAHDLQRKYCFGFKQLYSDVNFDDCDMSIIQEMLDNQASIQSTDSQLRKVQEEKERLERIERERKRKIEMEQKERERERKERERIDREKREKERYIQQLRNCVEDWETTHGIPLKFYHKYYPKKYYEFSATQEIQNTWSFIWGFKDGFPYYTNTAVQLVEKTLKDTFTEGQLNNLTLFCLGASSEFDTTRRFQPFAKDICEGLGLNNGLEHITYIQDGQASHLGGSEEAEIEIDKSWFRDKNIVLFDDVTTTGHSLSKWKSILTEAGAHVICAITLAQTSHDL